MHHSGPLLAVIALLAAAVLCVALAQKLRVSPVLGYLAGGLVIGPSGLALVKLTEETALLAEFGVIFLLFAIGLELPMERLKAMRRYMFGLGLAQVALCSVAIGLAAWWFGTGTAAVLVIGGALALSSTATVLQLLVERGEATAQFGRVAIAILLFQDLAVVPLLAMIPLLGAVETGDGGLDSIAAALGLAGLKAAAALLAIAALGRWVIRPAFHLVAATRNGELFVATSLLVVAATAWGTEVAGMSMALGAFLAGLLLAESAYRHQVEADIEPFRGLFLGLFFVTVGMSIDLKHLAASGVSVLGIALALMTGKALAIVALGRLFGLSAAVAVRVGLTLAQGGEFAFVILGQATALAVVDPDVAQTLSAAVVISVVATPGCVWLGRVLAEQLEQRDGRRLGDLSNEELDIADHVIIAGFGRVGQTVARLLESAGVPFVALDRDVHRVIEGRAAGRPLFFGDASRPEVLKHAGCARARAAVITLDQTGAAERAVALLRQAHPDLPIVVRCRDLDHRAEMRDLGATELVPETLEPSLQLGARALRLAGAPASAVERAMDAERRRHDEPDEQSLDGLLD